MNRHIDTWLVVLVLTMLVLGLVMVYSSSAMVASTSYLIRQCMALSVGAVLCFGTAFIPFVF